MRLDRDRVLFERQAPRRHSAPIRQLPPRPLGEGRVTVRRSSRIGCWRRADLAADRRFAGTCRCLLAAASLNDRGRHHRRAATRIAAAFGRMLTIEQTRTPAPAAEAAGRGHGDQGQKAKQHQFAHDSHPPGRHREPASEYRLKQARAGADGGTRQPYPNLDDVQTKHVAFLQPDALAWRERSEMSDYAEHAGGALSPSRAAEFACSCQRRITRRRGERIDRHAVEHHSPLRVLRASA